VIRNTSRALLVILSLFSVYSPLTSSAQAANPEGGIVPQWVLPEVRMPNLLYGVYYSAAANADVSYQIYTPEVYSTQKDQHFPVLYWLHGSGGTPSSGLKQLVHYFDGAIQAGKIPPMFVVFPNGLPNGMWVDSKDGKTPIEMMVITELIPEIDTNFRTIFSREGRAIEGFSMGGYGAARLGFKFPELFEAVSALAGGPLQKELTVSPRVSEVTRQQLLHVIYGDDCEYFQAQSPWRLAEDNVSALQYNVTIRQVVGDLDETLPANQELDAHLTDLGIPHTFTVLPGVKHKPFAVLNALGESNWDFYRAVFGSNIQ